MKKDTKTASPKRVVGQMIEHGTQTQTNHDPTSQTRQTTTTHGLQSSRGVSPGFIVGIGKAGYGITKALGDYQTERAIKIAEKCRRSGTGKQKQYAGELFNCSIM